MHIRLALHGELRLVGLLLVSNGHVRVWGMKHNIQFFFPQPFTPVRLLFGIMQRHRRWFWGRLTPQFLFSFAAFFVFRFTSATTFFYPVNTSMAETAAPAECEDCGQLFPLQQSTGTCPKCTKLAPHARDSFTYIDISARLVLFSSYKKLI